MPADLERYLRDAQEQIDKEAARQKELTAAAAKFLGITNQSVSAVKKLTAETDKLMKSGTALGKVLGDIQKSALIASVTLAGTYAELRHLASAASPGIFESMDGAMQILTAELGSALLPVMMDVTEGILELADWFENLDDGTKKLIAGGVLAIPAVIGLGHAAASLAPAARLAALGVRGLIAALGPIGAIVAGVSLAVTAATAAVAAAEYYSSRGHANPERQQRAGEIVGESELQGALDDVRKNASLTSRLFGHKTTAREAMDWGRERLLGYAGAVRRQAAEHRAGSDQFNPAAAKLEEAATVLERAAKMGVKARTEEEFETKRNALTRRAGNINAMIKQAERVAHPHYSPLADARKQMQIIALSKTPIEQRLFEIQRANLPKMRERLDGIMQELRKLNQTRPVTH